VPYLLAAPNAVRMYPDRCFSGKRWLNSGIFVARPTALAALESWVEKQRNVLQRAGQRKVDAQPINYVDQTIFSKYVVRAPEFKSQRDLVEVRRLLGL